MGDAVSDGAAGPVFTHVPADTAAYAGETVTWTCAATGTPPPISSWHRVGHVTRSQQMGIAGVVG